MRRDWWGRALSALIGVWAAMMIAAPAASHVRVPVDVAQAQRARADRTRVVSARDDESEPDRTPPLRRMARESSPACQDGGRDIRVALPATGTVAPTCVEVAARTVDATAPTRPHVSLAHARPPAIGPPATLI